MPPEPLPERPSVPTKSLVQLVGIVAVAAGTAAVAVAVGIVAAVADTAAVAAVGIVVADTPAAAGTVDYTQSGSLLCCHRNLPRKGLREGQVQWNQLLIDA